MCEQPPPPIRRKKRAFNWADILVKFRFLFVVPIVLPISFLFYQYVAWRPVVKEFLYGKPTESRHEKSVKKIQARIRARNPQVDGLICTARKPWMEVCMRNAEHKRGQRWEVDLGDLSDILKIDVDAKICRAEPMVCMSQLSAALLPLGLAPEVLPELDDLTIGGIINGYGIEGSSHIFGLFYETVTAYEIVLGNGDLIRATKDNEHSDLFHAIPWSHGSLGLLVAVEFRLMEVKEYMRLTYTPVVGSLAKISQVYSDAFCPRDMDQENPEKVPDFVEAVVYSRSEAVITTGRYASKAEAQRRGNTINDIGWWWKPWFYKHAATAFKRGEFVEYVPVRQYYHRHTRSLYWEGALIVPFGDHWIFRLLLGWLMPPKVSLLKLTQNDAIRNYYHARHACQDMLLPMHKLADCLAFCHDTFETYPLWLCPHRIFKKDKGTLISTEPGFEDNMQPGDTKYAQMWTDVGIWNVPGPVLRGEEWDGEEATKDMEEWLLKNRSYQCLYAVSELSETDFWRMFDSTLYKKVRKKYHAEGAMMDIYYKVSKSKKVPTAGASKNAVYKKQS